MYMVKKGGRRGKGEIDEYVCMETGQRATRNYELMQLTPSSELNPHFLSLTSSVFVRIEP